MLSVTYKAPFAMCLYAECRYSECRYAERCGTRKSFYNISTVFPQQVFNECLSKR
jgi:hypothetical protein